MIHKNPKVNNPARIVTPQNLQSMHLSKDTELVTRVFHLNTISPDKISEILRPLLSAQSIIEPIRETSQIIITDITTNIAKVSQLITSLDSPESGFEIGQYVGVNTAALTLIDTAQQLLAPLAGDKTLIMVPHAQSNSIFIVSTPFLVNRAMAILEQVDVRTGSTRVMTLKNLHYGEGGEEEIEQGAEGGANAPGGGPNGPEGGTNVPGGGAVSPAGGAGVPSGQARLSEQQMEQEIQRRLGRELQQRGLAPQEGAEGQESFGGPSPWTNQQPLGSIEGTKFFIHKLQYRKGNQIESALRSIGDSIELAGDANKSMVATLRSVQWIESSNSLIFTGTVSSLAKVKEFINQFDTPVRQVFIEMLVLDTSISDSLNFSTSWGTHFDGPSSAGFEGFSGETVNPVLQTLALGDSPVTPILDALSLSTISSSSSSSVGAVNTAISPVVSSQFNLGVIGRSINFCGNSFGSIGALVSALHTDTSVKVVMNPKILVEDNNSAEVFVGQNLRFKTQSIVNNLGVITTNNFEYKDIGILFKVTPHLGNNNIITMEIEQELTNVIPNTSVVGNVDVGPDTAKSHTKTVAHVPDNFFVVISGLLSDQFTTGRIQTPCLGGIPLLGSLFAKTSDQDIKRCLLIFIRPHFLDAIDEINKMTKRQQDMFREKERLQDRWPREVQGALDFFNIQDNRNMCE